MEDSLSHQECLLVYGGSPSLSGDNHRPKAGADVIIKSEMIVTELEGGAPSVSVTQESAAAPPVKGPAPDMEVDPPIPSPITPKEDDLLSGATEAGVEGRMATLRVSTTPEGQEGNDAGASS